MTLMDGKKLSDLKKSQIKSQVEELMKDKNARRPKLSVVLVGNDPSSELYVRNKKKACEMVGIIGETINLSATCSAKELTKVLTDLNNDSEVDGILLQLPLPSHLNEEDFIQMISPDKDVDGFHYINQGKLLQNLPTIYSCTPLGVVELLDYYKIDVVGKNVCMVGTSNIVGKPLGLMLLNRHASVDFCNRETKNLKEHTIKADILISATGRKWLITEDMVKNGAVVIDIGTIKDPITHKLYGDVDFENVKKKASFITPVPGGVGPMTIACLLENTLKLYLNHKNNCK
ncbi:bifunctional 5,10-methylenetetrahydrofolate dehydrogenase/5,10-methenyltetrahydrofolate cyclohydrolase [Mesoplasma lactucae]|uniref:Bifunctional protein FolD n=1 Tax=Mesoplasma lactucae ATCC 49193 TaxID=81460 RepID=A0A291IRP9_9MOLU|nr:bifunctional 5,10-methylenetetrahydrofolate dehydrogenase/5,10-methenyltetrahydrofolate cyclohydrolase [Mesoplasma lactucae]ATG97605.1 bifunctional 5,10-methylene-tetrahydrofolate dehydrogenase/5,10-methylene-tetrahydrofolate cyclohydrolase [Mesoplasma lactucae ATCC 49193]ATZ19934.1 methylenetetrahydrofolate dehydrogenase/methylenetetrahydrofolate cyclohydrolase [Mesoplasma lactucae ATCC 49193]MCL8216798.1 Bifunctional protein FolD protein [Mesoplasma lactucae ATCC 49193]